LTCNQSAHPRSSIRQTRAARRYQGWVSRSPEMPKYERYRPSRRLMHHRYSA
jgi:hypothetical protein